MIDLVNCLILASVLIDNLDGFILTTSNALEDLLGEKVIALALNSTTNVSTCTKEVQSCMTWKAVSSPYVYVSVCSE